MSTAPPSAGEQREERLVMLAEAPPADSPADSAESSPQDRRGANRSTARGMSLVRPDNRAEAQPARIRDISSTGIALLVNSPWPVGAVLTIAPLGWRATQFLVARVVHSRPIFEGWLHGCEFVNQLSAAELDQWHSYYCRQGY